MTTATSHRAVAPPQANDGTRFHFGAEAQTPRSPLTAATVAGPFSLVGNAPLEIAAQPGLMIRVRDGSLWARCTDDGTHHFVRAGECFVAERTTALIVGTINRAELDVVWA